MVKSATERLYAFSVTQDSEELHHLRIEIKKISALISLLQFNTRSFDFSSCLNPVKTISQKAGEIRNIQLTLLTIMRYTDKKSPLYEAQQARLINLIKTFCSRTALYIKKIKKMQEVILKEICDVKNCCILNWYEEELKKLTQFFARKFRQKYMHEGRKTLKKLLYVYAILYKPIQKKLKLDKHYLHKVEQTIGKWHDVTVSIKILTHSDSVNNGTMEQLLDRKQKLLKACYTLTKCFSKKAVGG